MVAKFSYVNGFSESSKLVSESMNLTVGLDTRYYFLKDENVYNVFVEPSYSRFMNDLLGNSSSYGIESGVVIFLNSSVGVETAISYIKTSSIQMENKTIYI